MKQQSEMNKAEYQSFRLDYYHYSRYERFSSEYDLARYSRDLGFHFFDADSKRFFRSRIGGIYHGASPADWNIFVTSEQFVGSDHKAAARRYTVRQLLIDGSTVSLSEFQQYASSAQARRAIEKYLKDRKPF